MAETLGFPVPLRQRFRPLSITCPGFLTTCHRCTDAPSRAGSAGPCRPPAPLPRARPPPAPAPGRASAAPPARPGTAPPRAAARPRPAPSARSPPSWPLRRSATPPINRVGRLEAPSATTGQQFGPLVLLVREDHRRPPAPERRAKGLPPPSAAG